MVKIWLRDRERSQGTIQSDEGRTISELREDFETVGVNPEEVTVEGVGELDEESFDDFLDDVIGDFIAENNPNMRFSASRVLKILDPTMYRTIQAEQEDYLMEEARENLRDKSESEEEYNWVDRIFRNYL